MNKSIIYCLCLFAVTMVKAQNNNSPYSIIGIGDIENSYFDRTAGMANTGVALWSKRNLLHNNPASYVRLEDDPLKIRTGFNIEVGMRYNAVTYAGTPITNASDNQSSDLQFKKIAFAIKLKPKWALSMGLLPFSSNNYSFLQSQQIVGGDVVPTYIQGSGNTSQLYMANSFAINKHLSFGIHTAIIFGQFNKIESISSPNQSDSVLTTNGNYSVHTPYVKFGFQYNTDINSKLNVAIGSTMALKAKLSGINDQTVYNGNAIIKSSETDVDNYFTIPVCYNTGIAATYNQKFTLASDYSYQPWGDLTVTGLGYRLVNSQRFSIGGQYSNTVVNVNKTVSKEYFFQGGFYYTNSYLQINGKQINDVGGSIGVGYNSSSFGMSAALLVGSRGTTTMNLVKENYTQFSVTLSYRDFWITAKRKYD
ncbi:MAG: hypothetical protein WCP65_01685 [Bacteroidota bacterium]